MGESEKLGVCGFQGLTLSLPLAACGAGGAFRAAAAAVTSCGARAAPRAWDDLGRVQAAGPAGSHLEAPGSADNEVSAHSSPQLVLGLWAVGEEVSRFRGGSFQETDLAEAPHRVGLCPWAGRVGGRRSRSGSGLGRVWIGSAYAPGLIPPLCRPPGSGTSFTKKPLSTAAATTRGCAPSAACGCPSSTRRRAWHRTTATSGWRSGTGAQVSSPAADGRTDGGTCWVTTGRARVAGRAVQCAGVSQRPLTFSALDRGSSPGEGTCPGCGSITGQGVRDAADGGLSFALMLFSQKLIKLLLRNKTRWRLGR